MLSEHPDPDLDERQDPVLVLGDESNHVERPAPAPVVTIPVRLVAAGPEPVATPRMVRVRVLANYRVMHEGKAFIGGETLSIPAEKAEKWLQFGFVEPAKVSQKKKAI